MSFCFPNCDFISFNANVFLVFKCISHYLFTLLNWTSISISPSGRIDLWKNWKCTFISLIYISLSLRWLLCLVSQIYVASRLGCDQPQSQIRYTNSLSLSRSLFFSRCLTLWWSNFTQADSWFLTSQLPDHF